ncbi:NAD(P)/FAD-dependent oxidoreductase [Pelagibacterium montanilacus]|uniref:NAD(P)/FAD-dependent oxidoreductase n=1 Tax=Pelagibacterium montanilacus TaxID=2185280 RepID=UPI000F8C3DF0|nr:FAD-dependent oxidoreductase [Pelagibacterium montanilacus]
MGEIVVIGAGVMGSSVAYWLTERGHSVHIVENAYPGAGASGASFAWVNANAKSPGHYHDLNAAGMKAHRALADRLGTDRWIAGRGHLEIRTGQGAIGALADKVARLHARSYGAEILDRHAVGALVPELALPGDGELGAVFYPDEFWIDPTVYIATVLAHAVRSGARVTSGDRVARLVLSAPETVSGVELASGAVIGGDLVVNCTGAAVADLTGQLSWTIAMASTPGLLVYTRAAPTTLDTIVRFDGLEIRPDGGGRFLLHDHGVDGQLATEAQVAVLAQHLLDTARKRFPALANVGIESWRTPLRPLPGDGLPLVGRPGGASSYYVVATHSGVTLAPHLGALIASDIDGEDPEVLRPYRPDRLMTRT